MLKKIAISRLFDLYSYELNLENEDSSPLKFITGPNGYGKSTMLRMLYAVYTHDCSTLFSIPFEELKIWFDEAVLQIIQERTYVQENNSDVERLVSQILHIIFTPNDGDKEEAMVSPESGCNMPNLEMFLASQNAYYINDLRLIKSTIDAEEQQITDICDRLKEDAELLRKWIHENQITFNPVFSVGDDISRTTYESIAKDLSSQIAPLKDWGLVNEDFEIMAYLEPISLVFRNYLIDIQNAIDAHREFISQLTMFAELVNESFFANKSLCVNEEWGFIFYSQSEHRTPLFPENLSSGERHMLLQLYELIFRTPQGALVLIDEPELSMHMYWQLCYSKIVEKIAKARNLQCIIATHSPQIFDNMWSRSIDLYRLTKKEVDNGGL